MLPGAPSRLPSSIPLRCVLSLGRPGELLGAWVRTGRRPLRLGTGECTLLVARDLGFLLRRCGRVVVRDGGRARALGGERLIAWRTLQIVTGTPFLPQIETLRQLFPGLRVASGRLALPLGLDGAEPALAACAAALVPVRATWIEYRDGRSG